VSRNQGARRSPGRPPWATLVARLDEREDRDQQRESGSHCPSALPTPVPNPWHSVLPARRDKGRERLAHRGQRQGSAIMRAAIPAWASGPRFRLANRGRKIGTRDSRGQPLCPHWWRPRAFWLSWEALGPTEPKETDVANRWATQPGLVGQGNPSMGHPLPPKKTSFLALNPRRFVDNHPRASGQPLEVDR
jgi:hypothetical protein